MFCPLLQAHTSDLIAPPVPYQGKKEYHIEGICPPGFPGRRQDDYGQDCFLVVPYAMVIAGLDFKGVMACIKVRVGCCSRSGVSFDPVRVVAFEPVAVPVLFRSSEFHSRELQCEVVVAVVEYKFIEYGDSGFEDKTILCCRRDCNLGSNVVNFYSG